MSFTVVFWNVQRWTQGSRDYKQGIVQSILTQMNADIVFLEESHESVEADMRTLGYELIDYVNTLTVSGDTTQLKITGWRKPGMRTTTGIALRTPSQGASQKRARLKVNVQEGGTWYAVYAIHANASKNGGIAATVESVTECTRGTNVVCGGDFNYDLNYDVKMLDIQQNPHGVQVVAQLDPFGQRIRKTHKRGGFLDFVLASNGTLVQSTNMAPYTKWRTVDHAPIMVTIG